MLNVGSVQAFASLNDRGFKSGLRKMRMEGNKTGTHIERRFDRVGSKLSMIGVAAAASMGTAFAALATKAVKVASDAEEIEQKFDVVFSGIQKKADETATSLERSFGLSSQSAQKLLGDVGDILTGFGFTQESALDLSKQVNELAVDLASFTNFAGGAEGASRALTKALLGEAESVKALGIVIRQDTDEYKDLVESIMTAQGVSLVQAKALAALRIATEQSKNAIGDFARTQDSLANQSRVAQERTLTLLRSFGNLVIKVGSLDDVIQDLNEGLLATTESLDSAGNAADGAANYFRGFYEILKGGISIITGTSEKFSKLSEGIKTVFDYHPAFMIPRYIMSIGEEARKASKEATRLGKAADIEIDLEDSINSITNMQNAFKKGGFSPDDLIISGKGNENAEKANNTLSSIRVHIENIKPIENIFDPSAAKNIEIFNRSLEDLIRMTEGEDFSSMLFDPRSIGGMQDEIERLNEELLKTTSPSKARELNAEMEKLNEKIAKMRGVTEEASMAGQFFSRTLADGLDDVLLRAQSVGDAIKGIIRQLASRALTTGIFTLLGGAGGGFMSNFFGGTFHSGGVVQGVGERNVNVQGGEMILTKSQQKALATGGGGMKELKLTINVRGSSEITGDTIRTAFNENTRQLARLQ